MALVEFKVIKKIKDWEFKCFNLKSMEEFTLKTARAYDGEIPAEGRDYEADVNNGWLNKIIKEINIPDKPLIENVPATKEMFDNAIKEARSENTLSSDEIMRRNLESQGFKPGDLIPDEIIKAEEERFKTFCPICGTTNDAHHSGECIEQRKKFKDEIVKVVGKVEPIFKEGVVVVNRPEIVTKKQAEEVATKNMDDIKEKLGTVLNPTIKSKEFNIKEFAKEKNLAPSDLKTLGQIAGNCLTNATSLVYGYYDNKNQSLIDLNLDDYIKEVTQTQEKLFKKQLDRYFL